jgi:hypothetical protein
MGRAGPQGPRARRRPNSRGGAGQRSRRRRSGRTRPQALERSAGRVSTRRKSDRADEGPRVIVEPTTAPARSCPSTTRAQRTPLPPSPWRPAGRRRSRVLLVARLAAGAGDERCPCAGAAGLVPAAGPAPENWMKSLPLQVAPGRPKKRGRTRIDRSPPFRMVALRGSRGVLRKIEYGDRPPRRWPRPEVDVRVSAPRYSHVVEGAPSPRFPRRTRCPRRTVEGQGGTSAELPRWPGAESPRWEAGIPVAAASDDYTGSPTHGGGGAAFEAMSARTRTFLQSGAEIRQSQAVVGKDRQNELIEEVRR